MNYFNNPHVYFILYLTSNSKMDTFGSSQPFQQEPQSKGLNSSPIPVPMTSQDPINNNKILELCRLNFEDINSQVLSDSTPRSSVKRETFEDQIHSSGQKWGLNFDCHYPYSEEKQRYFSQLDNNHEQILTSKFELDYTLTQVTREIQKKSSAVMSYMSKFKKSTNLIKKLTQLVARQKNTQSCPKKHRQIKKMMKQKKFNIKQFKKLLVHSNLLSETEAFNSRKQLHILISKQLSKSICHGKTLDKRDSLVQSKVYKLRLRSQGLIQRQSFR